MPEHRPVYRQVEMLIFQCEPRLQGQGDGDNATVHHGDEFIAFLSEPPDGTQVEFWTPYRHEEVPVERQWQTLERTAMCGMRHAQRCPKNQWFNAMRDASYKEKRFVTTRPGTDALTITSYERLTGFLPNHSLVYGL